LIWINNLKNYIEQNSEKFKVGRIFDTILDFEYKNKDKEFPYFIEVKKFYFYFYSYLF
jgi:hypothetical protein